MSYFLHESIDKGENWEIVKPLRTLRDCYLELESFRDSYQLLDERGFSWKVKTKQGTFLYKIVDEKNRTPVRLYKTFNRSKDLLAWPR